MRKPRERHEMTATVLAAAGGVYSTANQLGLSAAAVSKWWLVPAKWVQKLAELTGLPPEQIRPTKDNPGAQDTTHGRNA